MVEQTNIEWLSWGIKGLVGVVIGILGYLFKNLRADHNKLAENVRDDGIRNDGSHGKLHERINHVERQFATKQDVKELKSDMDKRFDRLEGIMINRYSGKGDG
ncbi:MAG: hypothetical protein GKR96_04195 [Gammaproteobacteria bacterium]|nr:hypothetical protein [Gammaproteobacteria bacterium]